MCFILLHNAINVSKVIDMSYSNTAELSYSGVRPGTHTNDTRTGIYKIQDGHQTGRFEDKGYGREYREDFTASTRRLELVLQDIERSGGTLPDWMKYGGISVDNLRQVVDHIRQHPQQHEYVRLLADGTGGHTGGARVDQ